MEKIKFSIVVAIYNVERYIDKCLLSLETQTQYAFDVIIVDDHSDDESASIAFSYASKHQNWKLIKNNSNLGLGATRNVGLDNCRGDYILFLDGDDWLEPWTLVECEKAIQQTNSEVIYFNGILYRQESQEYDIWYAQKYFLTPAKFRLSEFPTVLDFTSACLRCIKRQLLLDRQIRFPEGLLYEDVPFMFEIHKRANHITAINKSLYIYRQERKGAITSKMDTKIFDIFKIIGLLKESDAIQDDHILQKQKNKFIVDHLYWNLKQFEKNQKPDVVLFREFFERCRYEYKKVSAFPFDKRNKGLTTRLLLSTSSHTIFSNLLREILVLRIRCMVFLLRYDLTRTGLALSQSVILTAFKEIITLPLKTFFFIKSFLNSFKRE